MYSLLIKNATIIDGSGKPGFVGDVAVEKDKIVNISEKILTKAQVTIDAQRKILAPGFIDPQNHSDVYWQIFDNPGLDSLVSQGYTTILIGNCGASLAPLLSHDALLAIRKWHDLAGINLSWETFEEYLDTLSQQKFACNVGSLVGYSTLRRALVKDEIRSLEKEESNILARALHESLEAGAFGLSSGLSYAHEIIVSELELYDLAKILKQYGALMSLHLRSEGNELIESIDEALDIAKNTEVNLKISHLKARSKSNWNKLPEALSILETAYHKGANINFDVYPYSTVWQPLYSYLPRWAIEGGREILLRTLSDSVQKNKILSFLNNSEVNFPELQIASSVNRLNFSGKTIAQIAKNLEISNEETILDLVRNGGSEVMVFEKNLDEKQVQTLLVHPLSMIGTDGAGFGLNHRDRLIHPRCFGTAEKFLTDTAKNGNLTWEEAVVKLTSGPAKKIGLKKRGTLEIGNFADLVIFDPDKIKALSTYENPYQFSQGMEYVFVNGTAVVSDAQLTGSKPGFTLRKK